MKRRAPKWLRVILWLFAGTAALFAIGYGIWHFSAVRDRDHQLELARQAGIPIKGEDFGKLMVPREPSENAALEYRKLRIEGLRDSHELRRDISYKSLKAPLSVRDRLEAKAMLKSYAGQLSLLDEAVKKPYAWFDRDWSCPVATLFPELQEMRGGVQLFSLRSIVALEEGRIEAALADAAKIFVVAEHLEQELTGLHAAIGLSARAQGFHTLLRIALRKSNDPRPLAAYRARIDSQPEYPKMMTIGGDLVSLVYLFDHPQLDYSETFGGSDESEMEAIASRLPPPVRIQAQTKIIESFRIIWGLLDEAETPENQTRLDDAQLAFNMSFFAFPKIADNTAGILGPAVHHDVQADREQYLVQWSATLRVLSARKNGKFPPTLDLGDIKVSYSDAPVTYKGFGNYAEITFPENPDALFPGGSSVVRIPPELRKR